MAQILNFEMLTSSRTGSTGRVPLYIYIYIKKIHVPNPLFRKNRRQLAGPGSRAGKKESMEPPEA